MKLRIRPVRWSMPAWPSAAGTWRDRRALIIVAELDGVTGLGEVAPLPGMSPDDLAAGTAALASVTSPPPRSDADDAGLARAVAAWAHEAAPRTPAAAWGLCCAVLDAIARRRGRALASLLAPAFERAPAERVGLCAVVDGPDQARAAVARGLATVKVKLGVGGPDPDLDGAVALIAAIRAAVGPRIAIRADANRAFTIAEVPRLLAGLAPHAVELVEEPARGLGPLLKTPSWPPIGLDESLAEPGADRWLATALSSGAVAALVLKPTVLGPARTLLLARRARAAGVGVVISHALEGPVGLACCAELALALGEAPAAGLGPHPGLLAWELAVPTLGAAEVIATPRLGTGLPIDAVLARVAALEPTP